MTTIKKDTFAGGAGATESDDVPFALTFQDIADDLAGIQVGEAVQDDATDLASALLLVNELKGLVNTGAGTTLKTINGDA